MLPVAVLFVGSLRLPESPVWLARKKEDRGQRIKEKGESSDSFKRACVCWGIGRELYTAPFIWIPLTPDFYEGNKLSKKAQNTINKFRVSVIDYKDGVISNLIIVDKDGTVVWRM